MESPYRVVQGNGYALKSGTGKWIPLTEWFREMDSPYRVVQENGIPLQSGSGKWIPLAEPER